MKCNVCGNTGFRNERIAEVFEVDGHYVMVEGIPARVCERCGEATISRENMESIRRMAHGEKQPTRREHMDVFAFA